VLDIRPKALTILSGFFSITITLAGSSLWHEFGIWPRNKKPAEAGPCLRKAGQARLRRATQAIAPKLNDSNTTVPGSGTEAVKSPSRTAIANLGERMSYT